MRPALAALFTAPPPPPPSAQTADTVLFNGKVVTVDKDFSVREAIAIANGQVLATGASAAMKKLADDNARIDRSRRPHRNSRPHRRPYPRRPRRADLRHRGELDRRADAEGRAGEVREAAKAKRPADGSWSPAAGPRSSSPRSAGRRRRRSRTAPRHPVYIQHLYDWVLLSPKAMEALNIKGDADVAPGGKLERDSDSKPTGVSSQAATRSERSSTMPKPTPAQQTDGTKAFFREMNSLGITGIVDGGGVSMYPSTTRRCSSCGTTSR